MEWAIDLSRPTFIKVHRKYLSPDTLDKYYLPWEWDKVGYTIPVSLSKRVLAGGTVRCEDLGDEVLQAVFASRQLCRRRFACSTESYASRQPLVCYCIPSALLHNHINIAPLPPSPIILTQNILTPATYSTVPNTSSSKNTSITTSKTSSSDTPRC